MSAQAPLPFEKALIASDLVSAQEIEQWKRQADAAISGPTKFADWLVEQNLLTPWQARYLNSGRKRLRFGNYVLIDRIDRDSHGDSFVGKHDQLGLDVKMLFLSKQVSQRIEDVNGWKTLTSFAEINHSALEHIHLIDRDSGRIMIVTDINQGRSLDDPQVLTSLSADSLPAIARRIIDAVGELHERSLNSGSLSEARILLDGENRPSLTGVVEHLVARSLSKTDAREFDPEPDLTSLATLVKRLANRLAARDSRQLASKTAAIVSQLASEKITLASASKKIAELEEDSGTKNWSSKSSASVSSRPKPAAAPRRVHQQNSQAPQPTRGQKSDSSFARQTLAGLAAAVVLALAGYGAWSFFGGDRDNGEAVVAHSSDEESRELPEFKSPDSGKQEDRAVGLATNVAEKTEVPVANNTLTESQKDKSDAAESSSATTTVAFNQPQDAGLPGLSESQPQDEPDSESTAEAPDPKSDDQSGSLLDAFNALDDSPGTDAANSKSPAKEKDSQPDAAADEVAHPPGKGESEPAPPKKLRLPDTIDLPEVENVNHEIVAKLPAEARRAALSLISDPGASKSKATFDLKSVGDQQWEVESTSRDGTRESVGQFSIQREDLSFRWSNSAANNRNAQFLRNCLLKLDWGSSPRAIALRNPILIEGFVLDPDESSVRIELESLQHLPKEPVVALMPLDEEKFGNTFVLEERAGGEFSKRNPLLIQFSELAEYQMLFVELTADLKNRSWLEAKLKIQLDPTAKSRDASAKLIEEGGLLLQQFHENAKASHAELKGMKIDELRRRLGVSKEQLKNDQKKAREKELAKAAELGEKRAKFYREVKRQIQTLYSEPIPVAIYFQLGDRRIVLATTVADSETK